MNASRVLIAILGLLVVLSILTACGGTTVVDELDVGVSEYLMVRDAQGDVIFAYECSGTLGERVCELQSLRAGLEVEAGAIYDVPILGELGARLNARAVLDQGAFIRVEPIVGAVDVPMFSWDAPPREGSGR